MTIEARIASNSRAGATGLISCASGTTIESSCSAGRVDRAAERFEQFDHHADVGDVRDVGQVVLARGEQAGRHLLQHRVLGAEGLHVALECSGGLDDEGCHPTSIAGDEKWPGTRTKRSRTVRWPRAATVPTGPQYRPGTDSRHRGGRHRRGALVRTRRQERGRRRRGRRDALRPRRRRHGRRRRHRRGREGRRADALQRRTHRRRSSAARRHRGRPRRRHDAHRDGPQRRALGHRALRARHDVQSRSLRLHEQDRRRSARSRLGRHQRLGDRQPHRTLQATEEADPRTRRRHPRSPATRRTCSPRFAKPARASSRSPTATSPAPSRPVGRTPAPTSSSASAARPKA